MPQDSWAAFMFILTNVREAYPIRSTTPGKTAAAALFWGRRRQRRALQLQPERRFSAAWQLDSAAVPDDVGIGHGFTVGCRRPLPRFGTTWST
jgi:hypothetical protein